MPPSTRALTIAGILGAAVLTATAVALGQPWIDDDGQADGTASAATDRVGDAGTDVPSDTDTTDEDDPLAGALAVMDAELTRHREVMITSASFAQDDLVALRSLLAQTLVGADRDGDELLAELDGLVDRITAAADGLDAAATRPQPTPPGVLPAPIVDPLLARFEAIDEQAEDVAERLRSAAIDAGVLGRHAAQLREAAERFATDDHLPDGDDPDAIGAAWAEDAERLEDYREAARAAAELPTLERHAAAHLAVADQLLELAEEAVAELEGGDLDAYNARVATLEEVTEDLLAGLGATVQPTLDALVADVEAAETRTLGLLAELDGLRR